MTLQEAVERLTNKAAANEHSAKLHHAEALEWANGDPDGIQYFPEARDYEKTATELATDAQALRLVLSALPPHRRHAR